MPQWHQISFTSLELKALWIIADIGLHMPCPELERDPLLESAAGRALEKVFRAEKGMPARKATPEPPGGKKPGAPLDMVRRHRQFNCRCPKCAATKGAA